MAEFRAIRAQLASDRRFCAFHERRCEDLPDYYDRIYERHLGHYAELMSDQDRISRPEDVSVTADVA